MYEHACFEILVTSNQKVKFVFLVDASCGVAKCTDAFSKLGTQRTCRSRPVVIVHPRRACPNEECDVTYEDNLENDE